ncbi:MAG: hypothetical protein FWH55_12510 [Oscillospiraceae bacterium]|nr:hypothetical protein [Oscillospiraceae bacterium]
MSIRPIDMQIMIHKLPEVAAKVHGADAEKQLLASQRGEIDTQRMADEDVKEVHSKKIIQKISLDEKDNEEEKRKKKRVYKQDKKGAAVGDSGEIKTGVRNGEDGGSHFIDIKL